MNLAVNGLSKRLGGRKVVDQVSFGCQDREAVAVLGDNGAGKSTLLKMMVGIVEPSAGGVFLDQRPLHGLAFDMRRHVGYVPESSCPLPHLTVRELLHLVAALKDAPLPSEELIGRLGASAFLDQTLSTLSQGQRRRACLLGALVGDPWLLVLDEPTNGLNPEGQVMLVSVVKEHLASGGAAVVATHDLAFASDIAGRPLKMVGGRVQAAA
jgi:ABC-type multidrug transport system ATPase subunit